MDTYSFLRQLADSWVLLAMALFYLAAILWAFRPSAKTFTKNWQACRCAMIASWILAQRIAKIVLARNWYRS